ncbi:S-adenosyl-L-methionine-dependent methyltransferase [Amylocystis lapponica]|nr:S-adenosyl-L-methionine-dependent methyltransferase [Amylocystis lapponica]
MSGRTHCQYRHVEQQSRLVTIRALEFYSGIGGMHRALSRSVINGSVVRAFDWDQCACRVYEVNHGKNVIQKVDISTLSAAELAVQQVNMWLLSPSCQPYTVLNPLAKGGADPRAQSFIHLMEDVLPDLVKSRNHPEYMLVENVAGFETSSTRIRLLATLKSLGYATLELLLTPLQFGIPNSRLRYYLLAKVKPLSFTDTDRGQERVWRHIPGRGHDWVDPRQNGDYTPPDDKLVVAEIRDFLDPEVAGMHPHAVPDHILEKRGRLFDIVLPSARRSCCFTRGYVRLAERTGSVLQINESLDTTVVFDEFLEAQRNEQKDAIQILHPLRLRYFTPTELLRIFGFQPDDRDYGFVWPSELSMKTQYKLIGNSVNVLVVTELVNYMVLEPAGQDCSIGCKYCTRRH